MKFYIIYFNPNELFCSWCINNFYTCLLRSICVELPNEPSRMCSQELWLSQVVPSRPLRACTYTRARTHTRDTDNVYILYLTDCYKWSEWEKCSTKCRPQPDTPTGTRSRHSKLKKGQQQTIHCNTQSCRKSSVAFLIIVFLNCNIVRYVS